MLELILSVALVVSVACSALIRIRNHFHKQIQLPKAKENGYFDIMTAEDVLDGYPIDDVTFWLKMKRLKWCLAALNTLVAGIFAFRCQFLSTPNFLHLVFAFYTLFIILDSTSASHYEDIVTLTALTTLGAATFCTTALTNPALWPETLTYILLSVSCFVLPLGPPLLYPTSHVFSPTSDKKGLVNGSANSSCWSMLMFSYATPVFQLCNGMGRNTLIQVEDLPIPPVDMRAAYQFSHMKEMGGNDQSLLWRTFKANRWEFFMIFILTCFSSFSFYLTPWLIQRIIQYLESDPQRENRAWGWPFALGLFFSWMVPSIVLQQIFSIVFVTMNIRLKMQLNTALFHKTMVRKEVTSSSKSNQEDDKSEVSSKAQILNLMTTDVDRVSNIGRVLLASLDNPLRLVAGLLLFYNILGVSSLVGFIVPVVFLPANYLGGKLVSVAQGKLMQKRDERIGLMNEILGGIRMLKFMAWERCFQERILKVRKGELRQQRINFIVESLIVVVWDTLPILVLLVAFWHYTVIRGEILKPSIAFSALSVFGQMKYALSAIPEEIVAVVQTYVSVKRVESYLQSDEIDLPSTNPAQERISFRSATITWPQQDSMLISFALRDVNLEFPIGELSLICGKFGSGKSLLLLAMLGEVDILSGQVECPRSRPDALASLAREPLGVPWIVPGLCAYVPQMPWLMNASIKDNILFNLPLDEERYKQTLAVCALLADLKILDGGDEAEIGERGINLSGGQKARISLARAVYSRASVLFLDDVLSAVDAHTGRHLYEQCLKGNLTRGRTVILVSHHVQLCAPGASYVVALENGTVKFQGPSSAFQQSTYASALEGEEKVEKAEEEPEEKKGTAKKLIGEEYRTTGRISGEVWKTYLQACGGTFYWVSFALMMGLSELAPVLENAWLKTWTESGNENERGATYYTTIYALILLGGLIISTIRWLMLYNGSLHASKLLYQRILESVLFAPIRFHDKTSRGRLLNRFGKDFEEIDSQLSDALGWTARNGISAAISATTIVIAGGHWFVFLLVVLGYFYWHAGKVYGQACRELRRLHAITRSPLYSIYGESIFGVAVIRAFGASSKVLRDMIRNVDANASPMYWLSKVNRWLSIRFDILSAMLITCVGVIAVANTSMSPALAGFTLTFALKINGELQWMVRRFVELDQSMIAIERVKEFSELPQEAPEYVDPRPPSTWPEHGAISVEKLVVRYAPDLPNVLHDLTFDIRPGEKVGIIGRTGSGKSTLALSMLRLVEATSGKIFIDGVDIAQTGLHDLRSKLTIIPQDPTIMSGTLRTTLDVFGEYNDAEIFSTLRRVHLIPAEEASELAAENANVFRDLESVVSDNGDNFSAGERQLLCMARAILKRSKVLIMDEATASVDYVTDELIGQTIRHEFASSTILTIAHRLRTIIDYDRVMLLEEGRVAEFASPKLLLRDSSSKFYKMCAATGQDEFQALKAMAESQCI